MRHTSQKGFTLVEIAVVLVIAGVILGTAMAMMRPYVENARLNATREKLNRISDSLAQFAQTYGRLPCPAHAKVTGTEPFGASTNSGPDGVEIDKCGDGGSQNLATDYIGIIPFKAIGLTEDNVRDAYGNLITYAVDPVMAGYTLAGGGTSSGEVHEMCRVRTRWVDDTVSPNVNLNQKKAALCCPRTLGTGANKFIQVMDKKTGGTSVYTGELSTMSSMYNTPITPIQVSSMNDTEDMKTHTIAFILISHGQNGDGAYIKQPPGAPTNPVTAPTGAEESENRNGDMIFVDRPISKTVDNNYFDDVVAWRTNDQLVSNFGNDSCGRP